MKLITVKHFIAAIAILMLVAALLLVWLGTRMESIIKLFVD